MDNLTSADLAALRALCDKATPGPWTQDHQHDGDDEMEPWINIESAASFGCIAEALKNRDDAAFIAASREAMPRLLGALEEARESISRLSRRAQAADKALANPGSADPRDRTVGRALANWGYARALERAEAAESERDAARAEVARLAAQATEAAGYVDCGASETDNACGECAACYRVGMQAALERVGAATALVAAEKREADRLREALREARPFVEYAAEPEPMYGAFHGGDPRDFCPDPECSTEEEREKHRRACEVWEAQKDPMPLRDTHSLTKDESGQVVGHVARSGFGLGTYTRQDKRAARALATLRTVLGEEGTR